MKLTTKFINLLLTPIVFIRDVFVEKRLKNLDEKERFTLFYQNSYWKPIIGGSLSGSGSSMEATSLIRVELEAFMNKYKIHSMLDVPCGDWVVTLDIQTGKLPTQSPHGTQLCPM